MVNIKDIELDWDQIHERYGQGMHSMMDMLTAIFNRQRELMETYGPIEIANGARVPSPLLHGKLDLRLIQYRIKDLMQRTIEEMMEAANCLKNKPWKQDAQPTDVDHFQEEIADAFHFFVEMCITAGLEPQDLFKLYFQKSEVNKFRQRSGY